MHDRIHLAREAMKQESIDALAAVAPENVRLLSGYWPVTGRSAAIFARDHSWLLVPEDEKRLTENSWADEVVTYPAGSLTRLPSISELLRPRLHQIAQALDGKVSRIGIEEQPFTTPNSYVASATFPALGQLIQEAFPSKNVISSGKLFAGLRSVVANDEIETMTEALEYSRTAFAALSSLFEPGIPEWQLAGSLSTLLGRGCSENRRSGGSFFCASGPNSARASASYQQNTNRQVGGNEVLLVHCNSHVDGLWTDLTRTFFTGKHDERFLRTTEILLRARDAALEQICPGARARDIDAAARDVLRSAGLEKYFPHGTGHGVGFAAIDHLAMPRIHPASEDILTEGMVFNLEPAVYFEAIHGLRHCEMVRVTASGCELLSDFLNSPAALLLRNSSVS